VLFLKDGLQSGTSCFNSSEETYNQNPKCEVAVHGGDDSQLPGIESEPQSTLPDSTASTPEVSAPKKTKRLRQEIESIIKKNRNIIALEKKKLDKKEQLRKYGDLLYLKSMLQHTKSSSHKKNSIALKISRIIKSGTGKNEKFHNYSSLFSQCTQYSFADGRRGSQRLELHVLNVVK
jgi:hypothetical protein